MLSRAPERHVLQRLLLSAELTFWAAYVCHTVLQKGRSHVSRNAPLPRFLCCIVLQSIKKTFVVSRRASVPKDRYNSAVPQEVSEIVGGICHQARSQSCLVGLGRLRQVALGDSHA
ncbi:hypothetical protein DUNSADRAFT_1474 [Dunaliella salina]|uniref:Secreted protein n=1 Tax=Dunaliella salina TaxID=3046 RepID=A0ABQ7GX23_DUNSA|nr:hypothetical protein DUNSADRAFT_1474 [Dunaliella salina]|eukprot:KAF5839161.1 hypothetical protein DUNSADRAFT_1474 [Dunaliella salina]